MIIQQYLLSFSTSLGIQVVSDTQWFVLRFFFNLSYILELCEEFLKLLNIGAFAQRF